MRGSDPGSGAAPLRGSATRSGSAPLRGSATRSGSAPLRGSATRSGSAPLRGSATRSGSAPLRVLAAMSGGVDSAVAAARAKDAGHDVVGVHLALSAKPATMREGARGCCSVEDSRDARRCADVLDIPFYVWDMAERFREDVIEPFVDEYAAGRTPNPCLRCNEKIKFSAVLDRALALGFDAVATGHYARLTDGELRRAADPDKDQSYVLGVLTADQLAHAMFPLGDSPKSEVRAEAAARGLVVAEKPDSHDICFIPSGDTRGFLASHVPDAPGELVDAMSGAVLGQHGGVQNFTVGQRHGLGLSRPAPDGRPRYVLGIEPVSRQVRVGPAEALDVWSLSTGAPVWHSAPQRYDDVTVQVRAHGGLARASVEVHDEGLAVTLQSPLRGVAPGQAVVVYDDDRVLGSATIAATS